MIAPRIGSAACYHGSTVPGRALARLSLLALCACGDDGTPGGAGDASPDPRDAAAWPGCPASIHASFGIMSAPGGGSVSGSYDTEPMPTALEEKLREGECAFFAPEPPFCDPACTDVMLCSVGGVCRSAPTYIDIGTIRITGTDPEVLVEPNGVGYYQTAGLPPLYQPGDELTLSAGGEGDVPAIELTVRGVAALAEPAPLTAREHEDMVVTWEPDPSASEGTELLFRANSDHHGIDAYVECRGPDDGELVVPAAVLDQLILAGETGIGAYIENAAMKRVNQASVDTDRGCFTFESYWPWLPTAVETIRAE